MVSTFLASLCGIALNAQVRMCSVTSYELLRPYVPRIESGINGALQPVVEHLGDNYLANGLALGYTLGVRQQVDFGQRINYIEAHGQVTLSPRYMGLQLRWEY